MWELGGWGLVGHLGQTSNGFLANYELSSQIVQLTKY